MDEKLILRAAVDSGLRVKRLLDTFIDTPGELDVELIIGHTEAGVGAFIIVIAGEKHFLSSWEARCLADTIESCIRETPDITRFGVDDLVMLLRLGADQADAGDKEKVA